LATVWIEAAVPEAQSGPLQVGQTAQVRLAAFPGEVLQARIVSILPEANRDTRTVRVRLEMANPGQRLKAGMSGQIALKGNEQPALLVPSEAVIRTGKRALAYVVDGPGKFHPVEVQVGAEVGDQLVVNGGLAAGQQVVASAQFLIDSEASLRGVLPAGAAASAPASPHNGHGTSSPPAAATNAFVVRGVIEEMSPTELTLAHEAVPALQWPAMTMGFKLSSPQLAAGLSVRQQVRFTFSKQGEDYVITAIERCSHDRQTDSLVGGQSLPGAAGHRHAHGMGRVGRSQHARGCAAGLVRRAGHHPHQLPRTGAADRREPGHLPVGHHHAVGAGAKTVRGFSFFGDSFVYVCSRTAPTCTGPAHGCWNT
jgi:Cu/Ag efflux protein CusF